MNHHEWLPRIGRTHLNLIGRMCQKDGCAWWVPQKKRSWVLGMKRWWCKKSHCRSSLSLSFLSRWAGGTTLLGASLCGVWEQPLFNDRGNGQLFGRLVSTTKQRVLPLPWLLRLLEGYWLRRLYNQTECLIVACLIKLTNSLICRGCRDDLKLIRFHHASPLLQGFSHHGTVGRSSPRMDPTWLSDWNLDSILTSKWDDCHVPN